MMEVAELSLPGGRSTRTSAVSVARLTEAVVTASCPSKTRLTRETQPPHIISAVGSRCYAGQTALRLF